MNTQMLSLFPTDVMIGKLDLDVITPVVNSILLNQDMFPRKTNNVYVGKGKLQEGEVSKGIGFDINDPTLKDIKHFINTEVSNLFKEYCMKSCNHQLVEGNYEMHVGLNTGIVKNFEDPSEDGFHNHPDSLLVAIVYLLMEDSDKSGGKLLLHDPRFNANRGMTINEFKTKHDNYVFSPESGSVIILPAYLYHSITRFYGSVRMLMFVNLDILEGSNSF